MPKFVKIPEYWILYTCNTGSLQLPNIPEYGSVLMVEFCYPIMASIGSRCGTNNVAMIRGMQVFFIRYRYWAKTEVGRRNYFRKNKFSLLLSVELKKKKVHRKCHVGALHRAWKKSFSENKVGSGTRREDTMVHEMECLPKLKCDVWFLMILLWGRKLIHKRCNVKQPTLRWFNHVLADIREEPHTTAFTSEHATQGTH